MLRHALYEPYRVGQRKGRAAHFALHDLRRHTLVIEDNYPIQQRTQPRLWICTDSEATHSYQLISI